MIDAGGGADALAVGDGSVWVANSLDGTVSRIDPHNGAVIATIAVGEGPAAIATGTGGVWVANQFAGTVSRIDPATDTVARTITAPIRQTRVDTRPPRRGPNDCPRIRAKRV